MLEKECANLLFWCGALHDIAEKSHEHYTVKQIGEVQKRIEDLVTSSNYFRFGADSIIEKMKSSIK